MPDDEPLAYQEARAAKALDLPRPVFRRLVDEGVLPRGRELLPGVTIWSREELRQIVTGERARPDTGFDL